MVGDRLYTDMEMARSAGVIGVLVLTGEAKTRDVESAACKPDFVLKSVAELIEAIKD
ncbi:MAG: HAD hydrolase-like protein [Candidatus Mariimomonas ferrooxydans]